MKAVVFHGNGDIRLDSVVDPTIQAPTDAVIEIAASAICGTDPHMIRGTMPGMRPGTILGHEAVGVVEEVGPQVRNLKRGDRMVVPSTIACGSCSYCRAGHQAQCDTADPNGSLAGTAFFGGPESTGPFNGLQAAYARIPFANAGLVKLPDGFDDDRALLLSDIFPTAWFGAELAEIRDGDTVAVFGCGPVGQLVIASARLMGADRILAVDRVFDRLEMARAQGAEVIDFGREDPVEMIRELIGTIGVYPPNATSFPIGMAMNKSLTLKMGNCNHRHYISHLVDLVRGGTVDPIGVLTKREPMQSVLDAYRAFDARKSGWMKVELQPAV